MPHRNRSNTLPQPSRARGPSLRWHRPLGRAAGYSLLLLSAAACSDDHVPGDGRRPPASPAEDLWQNVIGAVADDGMEIGAGSALHRVAGGVLLADGSVAIGLSAGEVLLFDRHGRMLRRHGRQGSGPGEYLAIAGVWRWGPDSLAVIDPRQRRLTILDATGSAARTIHVESAFPGTLQAAHRLSDGTFIATFTRQIPPGPRGSLQRDTARLQLHGAEGRLLREPTMVPGREVFLGEEFGQISAVVPVPRQRRLLVGTAGPHIVLASPDSFTIRFAAPDGTVRDVFSIPGAVRPVSNEDLRLHRQSQMDRLADAPDMQERLTALLDAMPRPAAAAHLSRLLTDANGAIWLGEYAAPG